MGPPLVFESWRGAEMNRMRRVGRGMIHFEPHHSSFEVSG